MFVPQFFDSLITAIEAPLRPTCKRSYVHFSNSFCAGTTGQLRRPIDGPPDIDLRLRPTSPTTVICSSACMWRRIDRIACAVRRTLRRIGRAAAAGNKRTVSPASLAVADRSTRAYRHVSQARAQTRCSPAGCHQDYHSAKIKPKDSTKACNFAL